MRMLWIMLIVAVVMASVTAAEEPRPLHLMPWPANVKTAPGNGELVIETSFSVALPGNADARLRKTVAIFLNDLRRHTGMLQLNFSVVEHAENARLRVSVDHACKQVQELGEDESYTLEVTPWGAELSAPNTLGAMRGMQTFLQLVEIRPQGFAVPTVVVQDKPRFAWRGLMIDSGRHFMPADVIKRNLDGMAAVKLNVFHWHLSENQGFRVESKRFPKLQEMGSDGLYYRQDEIREIVAYARDRGIRVVPEFDMPGHSTAWFVGYPDLASAPGPYSIERKWGVFDPAMDPTRESTYKFLDEFIGEMAALFPDQFFHIGGDEVNGKQWDANPKIQQFMHAHGFKNNADLQAYFNTRVQKIVTKHGKTMEGWDEILRPDLPKSIVIQSWRGPKSLADAAQQGYRGLLSSGYYLDLMSPASAHYAVDPFADGVAALSEAEKEKVLGGEACMWAEHVSPENLDSRIWPRAAAVAERLWSAQTVTDVNSMYQRLDEISDWLDAYGLTHNLNYDYMLRRMAGSKNISALRTLADVVEPVKGYSRSNLAKSEPTALLPLNRMIDVAQPESAAARRFSGLVDSFVSGQIKPGVEPQIRAMLTKWRDNEIKLRPLADKSSFVQEVVPLSQNLSALGTTGLQALDYLDRGKKAPDGWKTQQLALVQQANQPKAELLLMVASPVQKLIQASAGDKPTELPIPQSAVE
jgi:hexosaminidase